MSESGLNFPSSASPLFISGMWRSGSSLLYALLNKHPRVGLMYEADMALMRQAFYIPGNSRWAERWEAWNGAVSRHGLDVQKLQEAGHGFRESFELAHRHFAARKGADIWGDKSPDIYDRLVGLARQFPQARFIIVWRSPQATVSSMEAAARKGARFFQKPGMALRGLAGNLELRQQCDQLREMKAPLCEIDYDDLVRDTRSVMVKVCGFLEIPFIEELTTLEGANRDSIHGGEHHAQLRGNKIQAGPKQQILPEETRRKIQRYVNLWNQEYRGEWPGRSEETTEPSGLPGLKEKLTDHLRYRAYRTKDELNRLVFCLAPIHLVRRHRERKGHG